MKYEYKQSFLYRGTELKEVHNGRAIIKMEARLPPGPLWLLPILVEDTFEGGEKKRYLLEPGFNHAFLSKRLELWIDLIEKFGQEKIGEKVAEFWVNEERLKSVEHAGLLLDAILPPPPPQLDFDIRALLNKDLMNPNNKETPEWYKAKDIAWFVRDDMSRENEAAQQHPYLYTKRVPAVGQRVLIQFNLPNGSWGLLSGVVTNVGPIPAESVLAASQSCFYGKQIRMIQNDGSLCLQKLEGKVIEILFGAVYGQEVTAAVSLDAEFHRMKHLTEFFRGRNTLYKVDLRFNDHKKYMWEVARLEDVV